MKKLLLFALATLLATSLFSQKDNPWQDTAESSFAQKQATERLIVPDRFRTLSLDLVKLENLLSSAPMRFTGAAKSALPVVPIPLPEGGFENFQIEEAPVLHPDLAAKYPYIRSYVGYSENDPTAYLRFGVTQRGFHAVLFSARHNTVYIDAYAVGDTEHYVCYFKNDFATTQPFECLVNEFAEGKSPISNFQSPISKAPGDCQHRSYRLALACTGEYAQFHGGTKPLVMAEYALAMTRVNGIFEREAAVTMVLVPNTDDLIFLNANTDPYTNNSGGTMLDENQETCDNVIGNANYDIGHVFSTAGGGVAFLGSLCNNNIKAGGVTGQGTPTGDPFWVDYVAHEMGHQFGGNHTQNNECQRNNPTAMEPGSASTIMGYAGICPPNVQNNSDDYFHAISLDEIHAHITGNGNCSTTTSSGNNAPTVDVPNGFYNLPVSTPFVLTAEGDDADGDALTYCWEQMNQQVAPMPPQPTNTGGPAFRSLDPTEEPSRYFPNLAAILAGNSPTWEVLPSVSRNMNFRCTVRDNHPGAGCVTETDVILNFSANAGPFLVQTPNFATDTWTALGNENVTWDVANTDGAPVNASTVDIYLSLDGGLTYPILLLEDTPNDGTQLVAVPNEPSTTARVMVRGHNNIFFDISDENFTIEMPSVPTFLLSVDPPSASVCPDGTASFSIEVAAVLGFSETVSFEAIGAPAGADVNFIPTALIPPGTVTLTVDNLQDATPGSYLINVQATSLSIQQDLQVGLELNDSVTATVTMPTPADGATEVNPYQTILSWPAVDQANAYLVEVSDNPSFENILATASTASTSFNFGAAELGQVYYWRVQAVGACNAGVFSATFAFQTSGLVCGDYGSDDVPVQLPDNQIGSVTSKLEIPEDNPLASVYVFMDISHSWVGDLSAALTSPSGTTVQLFDQPGVPATQYGCNGDNLKVGFEDDAVNTASDFENACSEDIPPAIDGDFQPIQPLNTLLGESSAGQWVLTVSDAFDEDGGALNAWNLQLCGTTAYPPAMLLTNQTLTVAQGQSGMVSQNHLQVDGPAANVIFTLLSVPENGALALDGAALELGGQFSQQDVNGGLVSYTHDGSMTELDSFQFDVLESGLHWLHGQVFNIEILENAMSATAELTQPIDCNGNDNGVITATASGGNAPLEYSIDGTNFQPSSVFDGLAPGTYTVTVRDDLGLTATANPVTVEEPTALSVSADVQGNDLTVTASGGTGTLEYSLDGVDYQASNVFENLPNGTYTVYVRDENGCVETTTAIVAVNTVIVSLVVTQHVSCFGQNDGVVTATAAGGSPPYEYSLNGGMFQASNVFDGLAPGSYTVEVIDSDGFTVSSNSVTVTQPDELTASNVVIGNDITVTADGGTAPFEYSLGGGPFQSSNVFENLPNGTYTLTVQDANGCTETTTATVAVNDISITVSVIEPVSCAGASDGVIEVNVLGGTAPYSYTLNGGPAQSDNIFENVPAGQNTVEVTDADGFSQTLTFDVPGPPAITGAASASGYTVTVSANGGTGGFEYSLDGGTFQPSNEFYPVPNGNHIVTVQDDTGCEMDFAVTVTVAPIVGTLNYDAMLDCHNSTNGSITVSATGGVGPYEYSLNGGAFQMSNVFNGLGVGSYTITIRDSSGFTQVLPAANIAAPAAVNASSAVSGNDVTVNATGGTPPYQYSLDGGSFQSSNFFPDVANGTHTVVVRDANGCEKTITVLVNVAPLLVSASVEQVPSCPGEADGIIVITVQGGTPPYQYSLNGIDFQMDNTFTGLSAGSYQPTVMDASGAIVVAPLLNMIDPFALVPTASAFGPDITAGASGGTPPFQFSLDGAPFQMSNEFYVDFNGTYTVTVMDASGCTAEVDVVVNKPEFVLFDVTHASCPDVADGVVFIEGVDGGYPPYTFSLNMGPFTSDLTFDGLAIGEYIFFVMDATGYIFEAHPILIDAPPPIVIVPVLDGNTLTINASGGTPGFQYSIDAGANFQAGNVFPNLANGTYEVVVMDENGCLADTTVTVNFSSVNEVDGGLGFEVLPNPSSGIFILKMDLPTANLLTLTVNDVAGRLVFQNETMANGQVEQVLDLQHLANGTYQLRITDGEKWGVKRLVVVK